MVRLWWDLPASPTLKCRNWIPKVRRPRNPMRSEASNYRVRKASLIRHLDASCVQCGLLVDPAKDQSWPGNLPIQYPGQGPYMKYLALTSKSPDRRNEQRASKDPLFSMPLASSMPFGDSSLCMDGVKENLRAGLTFSNLTIWISLLSTHCSSHSFSSQMSQVLSHYFFSKSCCLLYTTYPTPLSTKSI